MCSRFNSVLFQKNSTSNSRQAQPLYVVLPWICSFFSSGFRCLWQKLAFAVLRSHFDSIEGKDNAEVRPGGGISEIWAGSVMEGGQMRWAHNDNYPSCLRLPTKPIKSLENSWFTIVTLSQGKLTEDDTLGCSAGPVQTWHQHASWAIRSEVNRCECVSSHLELECVSTRVTNRNRISLVKNWCVIVVSSVGFKIMNWLTYSKHTNLCTVQLKGYRQLWRNVSLPLAWWVRQMSWVLFLRPSCMTLALMIIVLVISKYCVSSLWEYKRHSAAKSLCEKKKKCCLCLPAFHLQLLVKSKQYS